jgi:hypothetical protein
MNFRPRPAGNEWTWYLREVDSYVIMLAGGRFSMVAAAPRFGQRPIPAIPRGAPDPPRPAITSQAQSSSLSDGAGGRCQ